MWTIQELRKIAKQKGTTVAYMRRRFTEIKNNEYKTTRKTLKLLKKTS
jgi:hypothetical protein